MNKKIIGVAALAVFVTATNKKEKKKTNSIVYTEITPSKMPDKMPSGNGGLLVAKNNWINKL